ncbi:MAG: hypothetical protein IJR34_04920 [Bacteroidales bacterium]|nr:hypothetical protein [Bacteroidales bacterium]
MKKMKLFYHSPACRVRSLAASGPLAISGVQGEDLIVIHPDFDFEQ